MRKFIVSDLHGDGNVYRSIMEYLDNIYKDEDVTLYINGDLIDRGLESGMMLLDVIDRIKNGPFNIVYLGGNHELMMYQLFEKRFKGLPTDDDIWYDNGGWTTDFALEEFVPNIKDVVNIVDFISNLKLYHKFEETLGNKNIVLVHAACPNIVKDNCDLRIKDDSINVDKCVWTRKFHPFSPFRGKIGNEKYFSIVGHTPNDEPLGFELNREENYLNIDGSCARYVSGLFEYDHVPLLEIKDNSIKVLIFNNNNEIINGCIIKDNKIESIKEEELNEDRKHLDKSFRPKKLVLLEDGIIGYRE